MYNDNFFQEGEQRTIIIEDDTRGKVVCSVICTFQSDETGKCYIVYTDECQDEQGNIKVYASTFDPDEEPARLQAIETDAEWDMIEELLDALQAAAMEEEAD